MKRATTTAPIEVDSPSRDVFSSGSLRIGTFRAPVSHACWRRENRITGGPVVVFPRVPVVIDTPTGGRVTADAGRVMFYNDAQPYQRHALTDRGDSCEWFAPSLDSLRDMLRAAGVEPASRAAEPDGLLPFASGPCDGALYLRQRRLFNHVIGTDDTSPLQVESVGLELLARAVADAASASGISVQALRRVRRVNPATRHAHAQAAEAAREVIALRYRQRLTLDDIAAGVGLSAFHLARVFRAHAGRSLHAHVTHLRLAEALERLEDPRCPITQLAMDLGYSSHAHFTGAFGRVFGAAPSALRGRRERLDHARSAHGFAA